MDTSFLCCSLQSVHSWSLCKSEKLQPKKMVVFKKTWTICQIKSLRVNKGMVIKLVHCSFCFLPFFLAREFQFSQVLVLFVRDLSNEWLLAHFFFLVCTFCVIYFGSWIFSRIGQLHACLEWLEGVTTMFCTCIINKCVYGYAFVNCGSVWEGALSGRQKHPKHALS